MILLNLDPKLLEKEITTEEALSLIALLYSKAIGANIFNNVEDVVRMTQAIELIKNKLKTEHPEEKMQHDGIPKKVTGSRKFLVQIDGNYVSMLNYFNTKYKGSSIWKASINSHYACSALVKIGYIKIEEPSRTVLIPPTK
jgi:hypothetical protein